MSNARAPLDRYDGPVLRGIDVSHHQGRIEWPTVARAVDFAIIRTGDGISEDRRFNRNWQEARGLMPRGLYQYFRASRGGDRQALLLLSQLDAAADGGLPELPVFIDIERAGQEGVGAVDVLNQARAWVRRIESAGLRAGVYTGEWWHWLVSQPGLDASDFGRLPLWVPSYWGPERFPFGSSFARMPVGPDGGPAPWREWSLWQDTNAAVVPGIAGPVDGNRMKTSGARDAFASALALLAGLKLGGVL